MLITASVGLVINLSMLKVLHSTPGGSHSNCDHHHHKNKHHKHNTKKLHDQSKYFTENALLKIDEESQEDIKMNVNYTQII